MSTHEQFHRQWEVRTGSDRSFGAVFVCVFAIVGLLPLRHGEPMRLWALAAGGALLLPSLFRPSLLHPLNTAWTRLGVLLGRIVSPIVLGILFYLVVTPIAVLLRFMGKQPMQLRSDPEATSYWIHRNPPGPEPQSMVNQF